MATALANGGAIYVTAASLTISNGEISYCRVEHGSYDAGAGGGAIYASDSATLILISSVFRSNSAAATSTNFWESYGARGGALYLGVHGSASGSPTFTISDCYFLSNTVSSVMGWYAASGGAIWAGTGVSSVVIFSSNFTGNVALTHGGRGGAIYTVATVDQ